MLFRVRQVLTISAIEFLLEHRFNLDALYRDGVPYLSRPEEALAIAKAEERRDRQVTHTMLDVKETDVDSLRFLEACRKLIDTWMAAGTVGLPISFKSLFPSVHEADTQ